MNKKSHAYAVFAATVVGTLYYLMMWKSLPVESNCSFSATPMTDILAFAWGIVVVYYGIQYDNHVLTWLGSSVIVEHVWQLYHKQTPNKKSAVEV